MKVSDMSGLNPAYALRQQGVETDWGCASSWQNLEKTGRAVRPWAVLPRRDNTTRQLYQLNGDHALSAELRQKGYRGGDSAAAAGT